MFNYRANIVTGETIAYNVKEINDLGPTPLLEGPFGGWVNGWGDPYTPKNREKWVGVPKNTPKIGKFGDKLEEFIGQPERPAGAVKDPKSRGKAYVS